MAQNALNYIRAKTAEGLKLKCLENSTKRGYYFNYSVVHDGKDFYAWYEEDASETLTNEIKVGEIKDGNITK